MNSQADSNLESVGPLILFNERSMSIRLQFAEFCMVIDWNAA